MLADQIMCALLCGDHTSGCSHNYLASRPGRFGDRYQPLNTAGCIIRVIVRNGRTVMLASHSLFVCFITYVLRNAMERGVSNLLTKGSKDVKYY